jgi:hypothetical protein
MFGVLTDLANRFQRLAQWTQGYEYTCTSATSMVAAGMVAVGRLG